LTVAACVFAGTCWSQDEPEVGNPVGLGTVPPSSYQRGLVQSPNPIDTSGNLVITGNVSGGSHFRGIVPYRGVTDFMAAPGSLQHTSGALDSFMRYSTGIEDVGHYSGEAMPFYSQTQTVTTTQPGQSGVFTPGSGVRGAAGDKRLVRGWRVEGALSEQDRLTSEADARPISLSLRELERLIPNEVATYPQGGKRADEQGEMTEPGVRESKRTAEQVGEPDISTRGDPFGWFTGQQPGPGKAAKPQLESDTGEEGKSKMPTKFAGTLENVWGVDVYERMLQEAGKLPTGVEEQMGIGKESQTAQAEAGVLKLPTGLTGEGKVSGETTLPAIGTTGAKTVTQGREAAASGAGTGSGGKKPVMLGEYKSFAGSSDDKFNQYVRAAEVYMKQGKYYRAADAYTVASVYKRDDPLGYAGKSCALFAAGEYMSSALYLAAALELFPEYARFKIDIIALVGDKDKVETRLAEARQLAARSGSAEVEFLLSYVYYQLDRLEFARISIGSASQKMPDSPAVGALKKAIDEYIASM